MANSPETEPTEPNESSWRIPARLRLELLAALAGQPGQIDTMTYEEFLAWADEDTHAEWVDGSVVMPSPASLRHQEIQKFLGMLLSLFVDATSLGKVIEAPFQMRVGNSGREPDLLFVATPHLDRLKNTYLDGPGDLVIEIVSPESGGRDRGDKFYEYREAGIPEYWLIDPQTREADFYHLDTQGHYQLISPGADGMYHSHVLNGFWLDVNWLWQDPLPNYIKLMKQIDPGGYARYAGE